MDLPIVIIVNTDDVKDWHRGMTGDIGFEGKQYRVTCQSKYKLRDGWTRIRFVGRERKG